MSADNWTICPKCELTRTDPVTEAKKIYGQVSVENFEAAMNIARRKPIEDNQTLREDYEFYLEGFQLTISYRCSCVCGFSYEYKKQVEMPH